ncbi:MAG: hypothetical protein QOI95_4320 [Acidimicrobiaceae bacterium]
MVEFTDDDLQGSRFWRVNLSGSRWHGVLLQNVKITDTWVNNVEISGLIGTLKVNDVDVSAFVRNELDKRHPERRMLSATDVDGLRAAWAMIDEQARATVDRARALPEAALDESVDGEFSFLQTLRHLVFATDRWITGPVFGDPNHFHPLGYPHDGADEKELAALDVDARPSLDEVLDLRRERVVRVAELLRTAAHDDLRRTVASPNGGTTSVMSCIHVVLGEEWEHNRYANRDLDVLVGEVRP